MARYIDADKLIEALQTDYDREGAKADDMAMYGDADLSVKYSHGQFCYLNAIERVKDTSTSDVVPKSEVKWLESEVDRLLLLAEYNHSVLEQEVETAKAEVAREIFEEIFTKCVDYYGYIEQPKLAELKKKYTEDKE